MIDRLVQPLQVRPASLGSPVVLGANLEAVIEGEVRVAYAGAEDVLHSGNVMSTNASMGRVAARRQYLNPQCLADFCDGHRRRIRDIGNNCVLRFFENGKLSL